MKVILFLLLTLQLIAIVQSQAVSGGGSIGGGTSGSASGGGGGDNSVQATPSSDPTTPGGGSSQATDSSLPAQSSSPSSDTLPLTSKQEDTPTATPDNTASSTPTDNNNGNGNNGNSNTNNNNTYSRSSGRTRSSNNNSQGNNATNSPSGTGSTGDNNGNNSNPGSNNQGENQTEGAKPDNVGVIAGSVVGGVVGLALIGGLLTWLNRRGGCTSRTKRRNHDTFDDFAMNMKDPENATMGGGGAAGAATGAGAGGGMSPVSPFQRRMAPIAPQTTGYMNLGNDEFSETSTAVPLMNQDMAGYPSVAGAGINQHGQPADPYYGYANTDYKTQLYHQNDGGMDHWQQQQQPEQQQYYGVPITSPQSANQPDHHQMKPDAVEYKPHEV